MVSSMTLDIQQQQHFISAATIRKKTVADFASANHIARSERCVLPLLRDSFRDTNRESRCRTKHIHLGHCIDEL